MSKVRHYCATFFIEPKIKLPDGVRYAIYGKEICPSSGKTHWQSYLEFNKPMRMAAVKKMYDDKTIHLEERRGTRDQARTYCMKDNMFEEFGQWISGQGHRSDLDNFVEKLKGGTKLSELMLEEPRLYCQYRNGLKDIAAEIFKAEIPAFREVEVILITGPTGCGKTRQAMAEATYKIQGSQLQWWQDYEGDEVICIDEYNNDMKITDMLAILDGYKLRLNIKGSHTYAAWKKVYITTNLKINEVHENAKNAHREAFFRRIKKIVNYWDEEVQG